MYMLLYVSILIDIILDDSLILSQINKDKINNQKNIDFIFIDKYKNKFELNGIFL